MNRYLAILNTNDNSWHVSPLKGCCIMTEYPYTSWEKPNTIEYYVKAKSHGDAIIKAQTLYNQHSPTPDNTWRKDFGQI